MREMKDRSDDGTIERMMKEDCFTASLHSWCCNFQAFVSFCVGLVFYHYHATLPKYCSVFGVYIHLV